MLKEFSKQITKPYFKITTKYYMNMKTSGYIIIAFALSLIFQRNHHQHYIHIPMLHERIEMFGLLSQPQFTDLSIQSRRHSRNENFREAKTFEK